MKLRFGVLAAVVAAACGDHALPADIPPEAFCPVPAEATDAPPPFETSRFVAHAGGSPYGLLQEERYTNTREAFEVSYANGFRTFELDLIRLADGEVVVAHDYHEDEYGLAEGSFPTLTRDELAGARWRDKYDLLFADDLVALMLEHPDIWVILDTKLGAHLEIAEHLVAQAPAEVLDRMVPHLASEEHAVALAALYPFPERMIAVYRWGGSDASQLERMARLGIDNIMMWWDSRWSEATQAAMDAAGHHVWVHTPDAPMVIDDFIDRGVGVYSDGWIRCGQGPTRSSSKVSAPPSA